MLRLTRRSEYGLMAMAYLAGRASAFTSVREIGDRLGIPRRLLAEVLKDLARGGMVEGARGPGGGYRLIGGPHQIALGKVVEVLEGPIQVADCSDGGCCEHESACIIQTGMRFVASRIKNVLDESTLADLVSEPPAARGVSAPVSLRMPV